MTCDRCEELDRLLGLDEEFPVTLDLTVTERRVLGMLSRREICRRDVIHLAVWGSRPGRDTGIEVVDVCLSKLRKKLRRHGIEIKTRWGQGIYLTTDDKRRLRELCEAA